MKTCLLFRNGFMGLLFTPCFSSGQNDYHPAAYAYRDAGRTITCNVPLNEICPHAWRHFHRHFPAVEGSENWFASEEGYQVSFLLNGYHYQAYFDRRGAYRYSLHYYPGKEIPKDPGEMIARSFPDYQIDVVTEITDGEKMIYLVKLVNHSRVRTLSVCDGKIEIIEELTNGGAGSAINGSMGPAPMTPFISKRSDL